MISAFMARSKLKQIVALMEDERHVLLNGPLSALTDISTKRGAVLDALENGGPVARSVLGNGLDQVRKLAIRNKKLFEASVAGMKAATDTLRVMEENIGMMETYTSRGEKILVLQKPSKKDHRV